MVIGSLTFILLLSQIPLLRKQNSKHPIQKMRNGLILVGLAVTAVSFLAWGLQTVWLNAFLCLIVLVEEVLGRWVFYQSRMDLNPRA